MREPKKLFFFTFFQGEEDALGYFLLSGFSFIRECLSKQMSISNTFCMEKNTLLFLKKTQKN